MPTEVRQLRNQAGLTQEEAAQKCGIPLRTFADYDRGETEPPSDRMDHIRNVLGNSAETATTDLPSSVCRVRVHHAGAGPGQAPDGEEEIVLDERLFAGSGVDFDGHEFIRIRMSRQDPACGWGAVENFAQVLPNRGQNRGF